VPDLLECIFEQNENYQDFWFNRNTDQLPIFDQYTNDFIQFHFAADYNTIQLIKTKNQLYEYYPRTVSQFREQEVQVVESNPINEKRKHFQTQCTFSSIFEQFKFPECNKSGKSSEWYYALNVCILINNVVIS
jgi:hypothetical protein